MQTHERLEEPSMGRDAKVEKLVDDDVVLEGLILVDEVFRERDGASRGAGSPFVFHLLNPYSVRINMKSNRPSQRSTF